MSEKYDVGIVGVGLGANYGSVLTYFGLHETLKSFGKSVLMVSKIGAKSDDPELRETHASRFAAEHYNVSKSYSIDTVKELNNLCDTFVIGSDQVWNYGISKNFGKAFYLDFANDDKRKLSYAASFGHQIDFAPEDERPKISKLMQRFNAISVREDSGVDLCRDIYHVPAVQVAEPIYLLSKERYIELSERSTKDVSEPYLLAYILDPTPEKKAAIEHIANKKGLKIKVILDGFPWLFEGNKEKMNMDDAVQTDMEVYDFLKLYANSSYVITDSFHGTSFAVKFNKPFAAIGNRGRGMARFDSLFRLIGHRDRFTFEPGRIITEDERFLKDLDFTDINTTMEKHVDMSKKWLHDAVNKPVNETVGTLEPVKAPIKPVEIPWDVQQCRILVSILKQQGIKHVVASSGSRNVSLLRLFEANDDFFKVYPVADERSAAYFACGLASKLQEPVVICCTSGTAVSNYLPGITEAYFSQLPIIAITADRHPMYLNNHDDQTIPQVGVFDSVVKKSVSLSAGQHPNYEWYAGRLVKEAVLEATHGVKGPVHINVPIFNLQRTSPGKEALKLMNLRNIRRVSRNDTAKVWQEYIDLMKKTPRIMVLYGQNQPATATQKKNIEKFAEKYNCVIVAEHISNLSGKHVINPFNLLRDLSQKEYNELLTPDILISVGGTQIMNHPITAKLRHGSGKVRHFLVDPSGTYADKFFKLTSILECTQDWFFEYFADHAGDVQNNEVYFNTWRELTKKHPLLTTTTDEYNQFNVEGKLMHNLPAKSMLHLGVGNTFMMTQRFALDPSVEVECNMGVNGIDGSASSFMGQVAARNSKDLNFLLIGDLSFFYDMNSLINKDIHGNIRIMMINNGKAGLLAHHGVKAITQPFTATAEGWVKSLGFTYLSSSNMTEYKDNLDKFVSTEVNEPIFFEVFI